MVFLIISGCTLIICGFDGIYGVHKGTNFFDVMAKYFQSTTLTASILITLGILLLIPALILFIKLRRPHSTLVSSKDPRHRVWLMWILLSSGTILTCISWINFTTSNRAFHLSMAACFPNQPPAPWVSFIFPWAALALGIGLLIWGGTLLFKLGRMDTANSAK